MTMEMGEMDWDLRSCSSDEIERARMPANCEMNTVIRDAVRGSLTAVNDRVQGLDSSSQHFWCLCDVRDIPVRNVDPGTMVDS
jgi:hypothetical protein